MHDQEEEHLSFMLIEQVLINCCDCTCLLFGLLVSTAIIKSVTSITHLGAYLDFGDGDEHVDSDRRTPVRSSIPLSFFLTVH